MTSPATRIAIKLLEVRIHRTRSAEARLRERQRTLEEAERVRQEAQDALNAILALRDEELDQMSRRLFSHGISGAAVEAAMGYARQLEVRARAAEVTFSRADGEVLRARILRDQQRQAVAEARARQEIAQQMLEKRRREEHREQGRREAGAFDDLGQILRAAAKAGP